MAAADSVVPPTVFDKILSPERLQQFQQFAADWQALSGLVERYEKEFPRPHFGAFRETLDLQSITSEAGESILMSLRADKPLNPRQVAGYIGGALEAYTRCVADGKAQLDSSYRRSLELKQSTPELQARIRQELVAACEAGVSKLAELDASHQALLAQLAQEEASLETATAVSDLQAGSQILNSVACAP